MLPREHGAWGMLLLPFVSALLVARRLSWEVVPAAVLAVSVFALREPLVVVWRQARVWKQRKPETGQAWRSAVWYGLAAAICGALLMWRRPAAPLIAMGAAAAALTAMSTYLIVMNRQRSVLLQVASAAGLTASSLLAWAALGAPWGPKIWLLWAMQFGHSAAALLAVRARIEARIAARAGAPTEKKHAAIAAQVLLGLGGLACAALGKPVLALALALSAGVHGRDLLRRDHPEFLRVAVRRIGWRELSLSVAFSALVVAGLW